MVLGKELRHDAERARRELAARAAAAAVAYRQGASRVFVLEDVLWGQEEAGSAIVQYWLERFGVPLSALELDQVTRSTRDEAVEGAARLDSNGLQRLLVFTSDYHVPRARSYFLSVLPSERVEVRAPSYALSLASEEEQTVISAAELTEAEWAFEQRAERRLTLASWALTVLPDAWAWRIEREVGRIYRRPT